MFTMRDCNCKDQLRNNCCCRPEGKSNKQCVCVTESDVLRWNAAAVAIAEIKDIVIDLDDYITRDEAQTIVEEYVDSQGFLKSIPEYYETEEEVLLLLKDYAKSSDIIKEDRIAQILTDYATLAYVTRFALNTDVQTITNPLVATISFDTNSSTLTVTKRDGTTQDIYLQTASNGQGIPAGNQTMELIVYCNTLDTQTPATPVGGNYDFQNNIITLPTDPDNTYTWSTSTNGMTVDDTHRIWVSRRRFNTTATSDVNWSNPVVYSSGKTINTNITNNYVYDIAAIVTQYHKGQIERVAELDNNNVETGHYYRTIPPAKPVGGSYDVQTRTLTQHPHAPSDPTDLWQDAVTSQQWTDPEDPETTIEYTWFFTIGKVVDNNGTVTIEWQDPAVYGADYCLTAYNMRFIAVNYEVLADSIDITSETFQANIADRLSVDADFVDVVAQEIHIDSAITKFRGSVSATEFAVVKDNAYYTGTTGNVTKNTDIDQTLFSIAQNTDQAYDPTSPSTDVVLNIWNPGQLAGHSTGTEQDGGGSRGTLTGNEIEYTVNPKKLAQSVTGTYSWAYNYIIDNEDSQNIDFDMRSSFCITPKNIADSVITLPDPKTYVGCTINGSFETVVYPNMLECGTLSGHDDTNKTAYGPLARSIMQTGIWYTDSSRQTQFINFNNVHPLWCCVEEIGNILTAYSDPQLHTVHSANPYGNLANVPALRDVMGGEVPRITITDSSEYPFVRLNAVSDDSALLLGSYNRTNSVVSLDTNFYKDLYYAYDHVFRDDVYKPLLQYVFEDNVSTSNGSYDYNVIKELYSFSSGQVTKYTKIYIVPSVVGLKKILESKPLSFVATAKRVNTDRLTRTYDTAERSCKFYYWDIVTTDFTIVAVYDSEVSIPGFDASTTTYPFDITSEQDISASYVQQSNLAWDYIISSPTKFASLLVEAEDSCASIKDSIQTLWALVKNSVTPYTQNTNV